MKKLLLIAGVIGLCLLSFLAGYWFPFKKQNNEFSRQFPGTTDKNGRQTMGQARNMSDMRGQPIGGKNANNAAGEIIAKDEKSLTIQLPNNGSKVILYNEKTSVNKNTIVPVSELKEGLKVRVMGKEESSGIISAQEIMILDNLPAINNTPTGATNQ